MNFDPLNFQAAKYGSKLLYFDKSSRFQEHFQHRLKTSRFRYYRNILSFLTEYPDAKIYFTLNEAVPQFQREGDAFLVNMNAYQRFCDTIGSKTSGRFKAFIGQNIDLRDVTATDKEKSRYVRENATDADIIELARNLSPASKALVLKALENAVSVERSPNALDQDISEEQFIGGLSRFLTDRSVQQAFFQHIPRLQIETLKAHAKFLRENLHQNETFIQNWLDEDGGKYRKQRCLIFGLEYVDPVREGTVAGKRFDLLAQHDLEQHVIFELKSPRDDIFKIVPTPMATGGKSTDYHLSSQLSRAIPEVLGYKKMYEDAQPVELQRLGIRTKKPVSKCVIVLGTRQDDQVWKENFERLCNSLAEIELLTYNHLIDRLENAIRNLEEHTVVA